MFLLRNYNRFLTGTTQSFRWEDFYIHRFPQDFDKLVKFDTRDQAQAFFNEHPEIEEDFDAWILEAIRNDWNGSRC